LHIAVATAKRNDGRHTAESLKDVAGDAEFDSHQSGNLAYAEKKVPACDTS